MISRRHFWKFYEFIWLSLQFGRISGKSNPAGYRISKEAGFSGLIRPAIYPVHVPNNVPLLLPNMFNRLAFLVIISLALTTHRRLQYIYKKCISSKSIKKSVLLFNRKLLFLLSLICSLSLQDKVLAKKLLVMFLQGLLSSCEEARFAELKTAQKTKVLNRKNNSCPSAILHVSAYT
jgi:hypothetical protein